LDLPLSFVTVADVAYPQSADLEQPRNVLPQWLFKTPQIQAKAHPKALCQSEIIYANGLP
jgi:hypothetical protein